MKKSENLKQMLIDQIDNDLWDREVLPHYALIPDWYDRYMSMATMLHTYFKSLDEERVIDPTKIEL